MIVIGAQDIRGYIDQRKQTVKAATINRELCLLSAAINYARREWDWDISNPVSGRKLREPEGRARWITRGQAQALVCAAERSAPHLADFIRLALHTGCRKQELLGLTWTRVDVKSGLFHLEAEHTKTARRRSVPLNQSARAAILNRARFRAKHCPDSRWVLAHKDGRRIQDVKTAFKTACQRAGIDDFPAGVGLAEVKELLGHSAVRMTERYAHLAPERVRAAVDKLDACHDFVTVDEKTDRTKLILVR